MTDQTDDQFRKRIDNLRAAHGNTAFANKGRVNGKDENEVLRLAKLSAIKFGQQRKAAAAELGVPVNVLDSAVKAERSKLTKEQMDYLPHWKVDPWPMPVDGAALLEALRKHFSRYVVLPIHADVVLALWTQPPSRR